MIQGLGAGVPWQCQEVYGMDVDAMLRALRPAWWYSWQADQIGRDGFIPMIWHIDAESIAAALPLAQANAQIPLWLIGNEPEIESQSDTPPHIAAAACREWQRRLGTWAIPWAAPGVNLSVHTFEQGRMWLDGFLAAGAPLPSAWAIHVYGNADAWRDSLHRFRAWMRLRHVERPIIVSECGCDDEPAVLMAAIRASLDSGEVQAAAWFSARYPPWPALDLLTDTGELTPIGRLFVGGQVSAAGDRHTTYVPLVMR